MTQIEKLEIVIKQWESKGEDLFKESLVAKKHNYQLEAMLLDEKYKLIRDLCMELRLKVVEQMLQVLYSKMNETKSEYNLSLEDVVLRGKRGSLYVGENFTDGNCIKVDDYTGVWLFTYKSNNDLFPTTTTLPVSRGVLTQKYKVVYSRQALFKK